jgi:SAM-dependent methyltransferase
VRVRARCPACGEAAISLSGKLLAALRSRLGCPACGTSVRLSLWPRLVHLALGEAAVAGGFVASFLLETPLYLGLASASWFGFGLALPLSSAPAPPSESRTHQLRAAYDRRVREREGRPAPSWEVGERDAFLALLEQERKRSLLELGAAAGADAEVFRGRGLAVVCVDLSPEMVARCREKGLEAHVMDVADLRFPPDSFDAVYAMNCLVHVPRQELPRVLAGIDRVLAPRGLCYLGLYGGRRFEGIRQDDPYEPKRFFSHQSDEDLLASLEELFELHSFRRIPQGWDGLHFQSLILRKSGR